MVNFVCFISLLACGGAKIWDIKLTTKNPARDSEHLTYLFVDEATAPLTQSLQDHGVMCLNSDFISDYIVLVRAFCVLDFFFFMDNAVHDLAGNQSEVSGWPEEYSNCASIFFYVLCLVILALSTCVMFSELHNCEKLFYASD